MLADDTVEHVMLGVSRARSQLGSSPAEEYRARRNLPMSKAWIRWVVASTHETPERGVGRRSLRTLGHGGSTRTSPLWGPAPASDQTAISNRNPKGLFAGKWLRAPDLNQRPLAAPRLD
jgi:hypothetical protein